MSQNSDLGLLHRNLQAYLFHHLQVERSRGEVTFTGDIYGCEHKHIQDTHYNNILYEYVYKYNTHMIYIHACTHIHMHTCIPTMSAEIGLPVHQESNMDELVPVGLVGCQLPQFSHKTCCQSCHLERRWDG